MSRHAKPYISCTKLNGNYNLTAMRSTGFSLVLGGRRVVPMGDLPGLKAAVIELLLLIRASEQKVGIQANGNS